MAGLQFALPPEVELVSAPGRVIARPLPEREPGRTLADPIILRDALFTPVRGGTAKADAESKAPLDGARAVGIVRVRGFARVVMQDSEGTPATISIRNTYRGWTLVAIGRDSATFVRGKERLVLPLANGSQAYQQIQPTQQSDER